MAINLAGTGRIIDGDTIELDGVRIRLSGIDAPEAGQKCQTSNGKTWRCGEAAMDRLVELAAQGVTCKGQKHDIYDRLLAVCYGPDGTDLNEVMVSEGYAWAFRKYSTEYAAIEDAARLRGTGIWRAETQTPWDYRAAKWNVAEQTAPKGCPIKGNINKKGEYIYHAPWSPWYAKTNIDVSKGERWFCSEREALDAGWRAPSWR